MSSHVTDVSHWLLQRATEENITERLYWRQHCSMQVNGSPAYRMRVELPACLHGELTPELCLRCYNTPCRDSMLEEK